MVEIEKVSGLSLDIEQVEKDKLKSLFPQCFVEGKLDIDKLLSICGEYIDNDFEKYKFEWAGKSECYKIAGKRSTGTLRPCPQESVNFDTTGNLYIEGDNLEVLKLLQTAYFRKVKMIYIDPPYNTGNDFVYEDDFKDPIEKYKEITSQTTKSNPETMGRFHTNWLNMMYPRLRLAANLLRDDGVIFISIDDNEITNLRKLCDEVFGEENFFACVSWHKNYASANDAKKFSNVLDYILIYRKSEAFNRNLLPRTDKQNSLYKYDSNDGMGLWRPDNLSVKTYSANYDYEITNPNTGETYNPPSGRCWMTNKDTIARWIQEGRVFFGQSGTGAPQLKRYLSEVQQGVVPITYWSYEDCGHNDQARKEIKELFEKPPFDTPKPTALIKQILRIGSDKDSIILDFFSGSATTAHAVMQLNFEDGGNRKFICVQLPEVTDEKTEAFKAGYTNICEIGKERIRRAGTKIQEKNEKLKNVTLLEDKTDVNLFTAIAEKGRDVLDRAKEKGLFETSDCSKSIDTGFKVLKLDTSNLAKWDNTPIENNDLGVLFQRFDSITETIKKDRSDLDVVYEVMLKMGVPLDYKVIQTEVNGKKAYSIGEECLLLVCLAKGEKGITPEDIETMCELAPAKIIASEEAFADDTALSNAHYILKDRNIEMKLL